MTATATVCVYNVWRYRYIRVYQGTLRKGDTFININSGNNKKERVPRLVQMHSDEMVEVNEVSSISQSANTPLNRPIPTHAAHVQQ